MEQFQNDNNSIIRELIFNTPKEPDDIFDERMKNCPFCGSKSRICQTTVDDCDYYSPNCTNCDCGLDGNYYSVDEAMSAWNRRN